MSFATYAPGTTVVHRLPAGLKLSLLAALGIALAVLDQWWQPLVLLGAVLACYAMARLAIAGLLALLRPLLWIFIAVGIFHAWISGWQAVVDVLVSLIALVLAGYVKQVREDAPVIVIESQHDLPSAETEPKAPAV